MAAVVALALVAFMAPMASPAQAALPPVGTNFSSPGPYSTTTTNLSNTTVYHPRTMTPGLHPVILWGNGTGASPSTYDALLSHFASHGFIVAAANTPNAGSGQEMLAGLTAIQNNPTLAAGADLENVGATGHSQGGGGAVAAGRDARVDTVFPLEGWRADPTGLRATSAIYFAGENDTIVSPSSVRQDFTQTTGVPAAYAELAGASHFTAVGNAGGFRGVATAWARWQLADDANAAPLFEGTSPGLGSDPAWSEYEANALLRGGGNPDPDPDPDPECPWWAWWCD
jgi:alpha-beta hydrolase superfamily lysophospholipase